MRGKEYSEDFVGNKANNLELLKDKFNVPKFVIIPEQVISTYLRNIGITPAIIKKSFESTTKERDKLRKIIGDSKFNFDIPELESLNKEIIIRSAALGEDSPKFSFAGVYESKKTKNNLNILQKEIAEIIKSAFSERVYYYSKQIGLTNFPKLSLIIQNYVTPDYAGVCFSTTYYKGTTGTLINAVKDSSENAVLGKNVTEIFLNENKIPKTKIPTSIIKKVYEASKQIEKFFDVPQDIEWCFAKNKLYIVQSRPITKNIHEEIIVWDNSNIAESYSGIVLPLTCSFAQFIYSRVYKDVARTSNVKVNKINEYSEVFDNLLGFHYGRFYYNMNNWYKMLTLFPGYNRNKENLDMMISAKSKLELDNSYKNNVSNRDKIKYYIHTIKRIKTFDKDLENFKNHISSYLKKARSKDLKKLTLSQLWKEFEDYQKNLLNNWSITVDNDFLAMTWFGKYKKQARKKGLTNSQLIQQMSDLKSVISAEQVTELKDLSQKLFADEKAVRLAKKSMWDACYKYLINNEEFQRDISKYIETYGGRFANELKLEARDLDSDPAYLAELLYAYQSVDKKFKKITNNSKTKGLLNYYSNKSKKYLKNREELRLLRSQAFSYTRKLFIEIGNQLSQENKINNSKDVFYLTLKEIEKSIKKEKINLKKLVSDRKKEYKKYSEIELDNVLLARKNESPLPKKTTSIKLGNIISGIGCSTGKASGKITLMEKFFLPKKELDIVVVKHTDPGWTPLFGLCKGLIVENGGLLSHAAIISRELKLPCIIGVENATKKFKDGDKVIMNASTGVIEVKK